MENSNKSMKERLEESLATNVPKDLDQSKAISEEDMRMLENNGIDSVTQGPGCNAAENSGVILKDDNGATIDFERIMSDFPSHKDNEGKFKLLDEGKCHLEIVDDSIQLFENGELLGVMFPGDKLDLDFGAQTAKVIYCPMKEDSKELTFGQKAVKATFDPSGDPRVVKLNSL